MVYMLRSSDRSTTPRSINSRMAQRPATSALASSMVLCVSRSSCRTVVRRPSTVMVPGPSPCISSCIRIWVKNASNETSACSAGRSVTCEMGVRTRWNLASWTFFSMTRLEPFSRTTRSSLGRLKAAVWTPRLASPAVKTTLTTRIGASPPRAGFRNRGSIGNPSSSPWRWAPKRSSMAVSAASRMVTNASNAAL